MYSTNSTLYLLLILLWMILSSPQLLTAQQRVLPFHQLTVAENLTSQKYNFYVFTDSEGFVWISSINGLNRYDGQDVVQYHPVEGDSTALIDGDIQGLFFEDRNSDIWFGTNNAIVCYSRKDDNFKSYQIKKDGKEALGYKLLFVDEKKEELWLVTADYDVFWFSIDQPHVHHYILNYFLYDESLILENEKSYTIYAPLDEDGLGRIDLVKKQNQILVNQIDTICNNKGLYALYYEDQNHLWAVGNDGLMWLDSSGKVLGNSHTFNSAQLEGMNDVCSFNDDFLLVSTLNQGVYLFDKNNLYFSQRLFASQNGKVNKLNLPVDKIWKDDKHNLWISTNGNGVLFCHPDHVKLQSALQSKNGEFAPGANIVSLSEDALGHLWCLSREGIAVLDSMFLPRPLPGATNKSISKFVAEGAYYIFTDDQHRVFLCGFMGLMVLEKGKQVFKAVNLKNGNNPGSILNGTQLSDGSVLVGSQEGFSDNGSGLFKIVTEGSTLKLESISAPVDLYGVNWMYEDRKKNVYLARFAEEIVVGKIDNNELIVDTTYSFKYMVTGMKEDEKRNVIWIASFGGLFKLDLTSGLIVAVEDFGLKNLNGLLIDDQTRQLWVSTNVGLFLFNPELKTSRRFTSSEGLQASEFNFYAACKTRFGKLVFGGINGINCFDPVKVRQLTAPIPNPKITGIQINNEPDSTLSCETTQAKNVSHFKYLKLPYYKNTISFNFAALDYSDPSANQFRYRMLGVDKDWVENGAKNFTRYPNLREGEYTFEVQASSAEGVWPDNYPNHTAILKIKILPPWYRSNLAYFIFTVLSLGFLYLVYRIRVNQIKKNAEIKRIEAEYKQLAAETETAVLRLQMNPHFIFNSMNSISSYISDRDIDTANAYLNRFAKLMRSILKLGKQDLIPVADEIDLLDQYLKTEAMRLERKFNYDFDLGPDVDEDDTVVPTMILQPFVENAIWHGLSAKKDKGMIYIRFWKESNALKISVEDNGIGREAAKAKKTISFKSHKSQALEITRKRLHLLGEKEGHKSDFYFEDLFDAAGNAAGTRVIINLPIL